MIPSLPKISYSLIPLPRPQQTPKAAELVFFSLACIGIIQAVALFAIGTTGSALTMALLSGACAIGSQILRQAAFQKTFATISYELQTQVLGIRNCNKELTDQNLILKNENKTLKNSIDDLAKQIGFLSLERQQFQTIAQQLSALADSASIDQTDLTKALATLKEEVQAFQTLQTTILPSLESTQKSSFDQLQMLQELVQQLSDPKTLVTRYEELQSLIEQLSVVTKKIEDAEKLLAERIGELKLNQKLLFEIQGEYRSILAGYQQGLATLQEHNNRPLA